MAVQKSINSLLLFLPPYPPIIFTIIFLWTKISCHMSSTVTMKYLLFLTMPHGVQRCPFMSDFLNKLQIPIIEASHKASLYEPLSLQDLTHAIKSMHRSNTPGPDGFFKAFLNKSPLYYSMPLTKPLLLKLFLLPFIRHPYQFY